MRRFILSAAAAALLCFAAAPAVANPGDDVRAAIAKLNALGSYEMASTTHGKHFVIDIVKPNSIHMSGATIEVIEIGSTTYMRTAGSWRKMSGGGQMTGAFDISERIRSIGNPGSGTTVTDLGMKAVGGQPCHVYAIASARATSTVYVGADGLPHRIETGTMGSVDFSKFNSVAPIRPPM